MEVIGAVSTVAKLMAGAGQASGLAADIFKSFRDAPKELSRLATQFALAKLRMQQIQQFGDELSNSDMEDLFPEEHRTLLVAVLEPSISSLQDLRCLKPATKADGFRTKFSWATLDKKRVDRIMKDLADTNVLLSQCLDVFSARLDILNHTNIGALRAGQTAIQATGLMLQTSVVDIQRTQGHAAMRAQQSMAVSQSTHNLLQESLEEQRKLIAEQRAAMGMLTSLIQQNSLPANVRPMMEYTETSLTDQSSLSRNGHRSSDKEQVIHKTSEELLTFDLKPRSSNKLIELPRVQRTNGSTTIEWKVGELPVVYAPAIRLHNPDSEPWTSSPIAAKVRLRQKIRGRRTDTNFKAQLHIFGGLILQVEFQIRMVARAWFSMPRIGSSMTAVNIRPGDSPIFEAIEDLDMLRVQTLLDNGEASIYDVSTFNGHTLLGTLLFSSCHSPADSESYGTSQSAVEALASYLLRQGCDPNVLSQTIRESPSLMAYSLWRGSLNIPKLLYDHGADPEWSPIHEYMYWLDSDMIGKQLRLMKNWDIWDTVVDDDWLSFQKSLNHCCMAGDAELMVWLIEERGFNVNQLWLTNTPLQVALEYGSLELAAIMIAYGARMELDQGIEDDELDDEPDDSALSHILRLTTALTPVHLLLFNGAHPGHTWDDMFGWVFNNDQVRYLHRFAFDQLVGVAAHMLFHGANCHYLSADRFEPSPIVGRSAQMHQYIDNKMQAPEELRGPPQKRTMWTNTGIICLDEFDLDDELYANRHNTAIEVGHSLLHTDSGLGLDLDPDTDEDDGYCSDASSNYDREFSHDLFEELQINKRTGTFSKLVEAGSLISESDNKDCGKAEFRKAVSTKKGRRRLARYPVATAYLTAIQTAGYRAEMDDEGDIWWSDDDGDQYFDAREDQRSSDADDGVVANCPMCEKPDAWGIGSIKRRESDGIELMRKYKEKKKGRVNWSKTYGS